MYFTSAYAVSCGEDRFSVTCSLCPKGNIINGHDWCAGNCYFDDEIGICKEKSKFGHNYKVWRFTTNKLFRKFRGFISLWYICWAISDDYKMRLQGHCLRTGATFATVGHAKYACSKDSNCVGVQNPQCDNLISTVCLYAVYQKTKFFTKQYSRKVVSDEYRNCTYIRHEKWVFQSLFCRYKN